MSTIPPTRRRRHPPAILAVPLLTVFLAGCGSTFVGKHEIQGDNWDQVLLSDESQVKVRNAQSRVYDTTDIASEKQRMFQALVATYQDLGFQVEVLDPTLGIISGKKYLAAERPSRGGLPTYLLYDEESLVVFNRNYRTWGPFQARADMVRLTTSLRQRNTRQLVVRASAQYYLRAIEEPEAYQKFYAAFEKALFAERSARDPDASPLVPTDVTPEEL